MAQGEILTYRNYKLESATEAFMLQLCQILVRIASYTLSDHTPDQPAV